MQDGGTPEKPAPQDDENVAQSAYPEAIKKNVNASNLPNAQIFGGAERQT